VDDEQIILNGLKHMISSEKTLFTDIECASDAFDALSLIETFKPDLVISDIQMPAMDGLELIREAQQRNIKRFVILSGYDFFDYARQALRLHVTDYLLKPIQQRELVEVLNRISLEVLEERSHMQQEESKENHSFSNQTANIRKFKAYVQEHFMHDVSLDDVAGHLGLRSNYVCNILKRELGLTFVHYLHYVRIEKAKELLTHRDFLTVEQVAKSVGYEATRHFYKIFKQYTGQTPGGFKNQTVGAANEEADSCKPESYRT
jgi:YesN/AraC family two-component response regulator